jgi:transcriptional regulator GlxA family with amidase domain
MKIGFLIFNGMTSLDFIGVYDPVIRLNTMGFRDDVQWDICAYTDKVSDDSGLIFTPTKIKETLGGYDLLIIPGGLGTRKLIHDTDFIQWLQTARDCPLIASVCTGSLLLGAAGFLLGKKATTHPNAFSLLKEYCQEVLDQRIVSDEGVVTSRGVTSGIDLGLYLCEKFSNSEVKEKIRIQMDYKTKDKR